MRRLGSWSLPIGVCVASLFAAACGGGRVNTTTTDAKTNSAASCPSGAKCIAVDPNGAPNPSGTSIAQCSGTFPDYVDIVPAGFTGDRFVLSQAYPKVLPTETLPWSKVGFTTAAGASQYLALIRAYVYEGMREADWRGERNAARHWYHVPWMTAGRHPREFVRGLTEERPLVGPELGIKPGRTVQNWAVGLYNEAGALTIGQIWSNSTAPDPSKAQSPEGTVVFKVLFSAAQPDDFSGADLLAGAPSWQANIFKQRGQPDKEIRSVRLLQMDVAVRDARATATGWVFGTFAYDASSTATDPWDRMAPVGLMWGNDPVLTPAAYSTGKRPVETIVDPAAPAYARAHLGWLDRMNGPVDNPVSACLSCHSTAQVAAVAPLVPPNQCSDSEKMLWFRNLSGSTAFGAIATGSCSPTSNVKAIALDYSLQQAAALQNASSGTSVNSCSANVPDQTFTTQSTPKKVDVSQPQPHIYPVER